MDNESTNWRKIQRVSKIFGNHDRSLDVIMHVPHQWCYWAGIFAFLYPPWRQPARELLEGANKSGVVWLKEETMQDKSLKGELRSRSTAAIVIGFIIMHFSTMPSLLWSRFLCSLTERQKVYCRRFGHASRKHSTCSIGLRGAANRFLPVSVHGNVAVQKNECAAPNVFETYGTYYPLI